MEPRALRRVTFLTGLLITIAAVITASRMRTEERAIEVALIAAIAVGAFLLISGLIGMLTEPTQAEVETFDEETEPAPQPERRAPSIATAMGIYLFILAALAGVIVGIAQDDPGVGIQTFTFGLILGAVVWGIGVVLGHRPVEE